jgi:polyisoprenyl-phosphate glycosyltransferase
MSSPAYSIVIPFFSEEEALPELAKRISAVADRLDGAVEIILVDDGSRDRSYPIALELTERDPRFKLIRLSRNFGHQIAITAGLDVASGEAVVVIDADLQDPPEVIIEMAARWREGYAVVNAVREAREGESFFKRVTSSRAFAQTLQGLGNRISPGREIGVFSNSEFSEDEQNPAEN